jgi:hypothetical protein
MGWKKRGEGMEGERLSYGRERGRYGRDGRSEMKGRKE